MEQHTNHAAILFFSFHSVINTFSGQNPFTEYTNGSKSIWFKNSAFSITKKRRKMSTWKCEKKVKWKCQKGVFFLVSSGPKMWKQARVWKFWQQKFSFSYGEKQQTPAQTLTTTKMSKNTLLYEQKEKKKRIKNNIKMKHLRKKIKKKKNIYTKTHLVTKTLCQIYVKIENSKH